MNNRILEVFLLITNMTVFCMELNFVMVRKLVMQVGEIGPVELEIIIASIICSAGYLGPEFYLTSVSDTFEGLKGNSIAENLSWGHALGGIFLPL